VGEHDRELAVKVGLPPWSTPTVIVSVHIDAVVVEHAVVVVEVDNGEQVA
jgi:hypothetical protein